MLVLSMKDPIATGADLIVHPTDRKGMPLSILTSGFVKRIPQMHEKHLQYCEKGVIKEGVVWVFQRQKGVMVACVGSERIEGEAVEDVLRKIFCTFEQKGYTSISMPFLKGDAEDIQTVAKRYVGYMDWIPVPVHLCFAPHDEESLNWIRSNYYYLLSDETVTDES